MPNRTLEQALREHTGCTHKRFHHDLAAAVTPIATAMGDTAVGSDIFHSLARAILGVEGHERHQMAISDDEYASFVREPASEEPANA